MSVPGPHPRLRPVQGVKKRNSGTAAWGRSFGVRLTSSSSSREGRPPPAPTARCPTRSQVSQVSAGSGRTCGGGKREESRGAPSLSSSSSAATPSGARGLSCWGLPGAVPARTEVAAAQRESAPGGRRQLGHDPRGAPGGLWPLNGLRQTLPSGPRPSRPPAPLMSAGTPRSGLGWGAPPSERRRAWPAALKIGCRERPFKSLPTDSGPPRHPRIELAARRLALVALETGSPYGTRGSPSHPRLPTRWDWGEGGRGGRVRGSRRERLKLHLKSARPKSPELGLKGN